MCLLSRHGNQRGPEVDSNPLNLPSAWCCHLGGRSYERERGKVRESESALSFHPLNKYVGHIFSPFFFLHCPLSLLRQQTAIEIFWHATLCFHYSQKIWQQSGGEREDGAGVKKKELNGG